MKPALQRLCAVPLLLLLVGCASPTPVTLESDTPATQAEPDLSPSQDPMIQGLQECEAGTQSAIETTVNSQTSAFAGNDFELAYSFASPSFRSNVTLEGFVEIIAGSYGPLIESSRLSFSDCLVDLDSGLAAIDVRFLQSGNDVYALRYLMIETTDGWRVQGASNLQAVGQGT